MTDEVISENNDNNNNDTSTSVEPFVLPRLDWYDSDGRIYKDALIENFNAIEARLKELGAIGESLIIDDQGIDVSDIHLDDVTMEDLPAKILNFRSLLDVVNLVNYPLECTFNGKKLVRLAYYNSNYEYKAITNKSLSVNTTNKYVYFNYVNNTVAASNATTSPTNSILIGVFADGAIRGLNSMDYANINALYYLARMSEDVYGPYRISKDTRDSRPHGDIALSVNEHNRGVLSDDTDTGTAYWNHVYVRDVGRT